jgi:hypothetical protein
MERDYKQFCKSNKEIEDKEGLLFFLSPGLGKVTEKSIEENKPIPGFIKAKGGGTEAGSCHWKMRKRRKEGDSLRAGKKWRSESPEGKA